jgi:hypothetical protein
MGTDASCHDVVRHDKAAGNGSNRRTISYPKTTHSGRRDGAYARRAVIRDKGGVKMRRWLNKHWLYAIAGSMGLVLTPVAIRSAYIQRGYFAVGGEWLVLPLVLMVAMLINEIKAAINVFTVSTKVDEMSMDPVDSDIKKDA